MKKVVLATVFSGIGAIEQALIKQNIDHEITFACDNGERELKLSEEEIKAMLKDKNRNERKAFIDGLYAETKKANFVEQSYMANYDIDKENFYQDIRFLDGKDYSNKIDLFILRGIHTPILG